VIRLLLDRHSTVNSTTLRPFDDLRYDRRPIYVWAAALISE